MIALSLFVSTFVLVFALGFQSLNVNNFQYRAAFLTSFVIGISHLVLYKLTPDATMLESATFISGGPFGIVASMWAHQRLFRKRSIDELNAASAYDAVMTHHHPGELIIDGATGLKWKRDAANANWILVSPWVEKTPPPYPFTSTNINCGDAAEAPQHLPLRPWWHRRRSAR